MSKKNKFWKYILLAGIREYRETNKFSIHKFNFYIIYSLITAMICFTMIYLGINKHFVSYIIIGILLLLSYQTVEFDNYISFCQNKNNKIILAYPIDCDDILIVNSLKYLLFHIIFINLGVLPFALVILYLEGITGFILKFYMIVNILCILACMLGWGRWIFKWQDVKLEKKSIWKDIGTIIVGIVFLFIVDLIKKQKDFIIDILNKIKIINTNKYNFYEHYIYWIIGTMVCITLYIIFRYIKAKLFSIYEFYILDKNKGGKNISKKTNYLEKFLKKHKKINIYLKKELYVIARNENIYNEMLKKIKYSIILPTLFSLYYLINPFKIDFYTTCIFIILGINSYGDKIIRNFLSISAEGKMIINYIQSSVEIKKIILNKVNMLFLYRQLFIIGPIIFVISVTNLNVLNIVYFVIIWIIMCYTSANIKIYSVSINTKFLTTEDFFKKMSVYGLFKYIIFESSYYYILFGISVLCKIFISNPISIVIGILWISVIYNFAIFILQGDGKKFYGEFKIYV